MKKLTGFDQAILILTKRWCKEKGWPSDFDNIILPIYKKYGWIMLSAGVTIDINCGEVMLIDMDLDLLSTFVYFDEAQHKYLAY